MIDILHVCIQNHIVDDDGEVSIYGVSGSSLTNEITVPVLHMQH